MAAIAWSDIDALPDVLANDRFQFLMAPSVNADLNSTLALRCQQVSVPEEMFEPMVVALQGFEFSFRGRHVFDKLISATFIETVDGAVSTGISQWMQSIGGTESGNGGTKKTYSTTATLNVFDQSGNTALAFTIKNLWPSQVPTTQLDGSQTSPYIKQIQFTYDKFLPPNGGSES